MRRVFRIPFGRAHIGREVDDELEFHLEMRAQRLIAAGWTPDAARREALRQFGDLDSVRQDCVVMDEQRERAVRRANVMSELQQDISYALRTLRRNLGFTTVIVGALALGIGANTAIFTLIDAVVVRSLPVVHPEQLVAVGDPTRVASMSGGSPRTDLLSYPLFRDLRDQNHVFSGVLASGRTDRLDVRIEGTSGEFEHPRGRFVSGNYFSLLGVSAFAGRTFDTGADASPGASPIATISYGYWTRRFHNDPSAIGRTILVNGIKIVIVGVTGPSYSGEIVGQAPDLWLPVSMHDALRPNQKLLDDRMTSWLLVLGRLRPGVTMPQGKQQVSAVLKQSIVANSAPLIAKSFLDLGPKYFVSSGAKGFSRVRNTFQTPLLTLMIGVGLLLCIICANVANLLLARAIARGREMAVRLALGAGRARLVRQLLTESAILALLSAGVGLLVAWWGSRALLRVASDGSPVSLALGTDVIVLAFTLAVSVLAVALFGVVPALRASRVDLASAMRAQSPSLAGSASGTRGERVPLAKILIAGQVALSVVLVIGAAMLVRSLRNVQAVDVGLDRDHLVIVGLDIGSRGLEGDALANLVHAVRDRIASVPGVSAVTFSANGIFSGTESSTTIEVPGFAARTPDDTTIAYDMVGPDYVRGIGGKLIAGRDMATRDEPTLPRVALVNQSLARFYFPGQNAVGKYLRFNDSVAVEIIGIVADTRDHGLEGQPLRRAYFSYVHAADPKNLGAPGSLRVEVRTVGDPSVSVQPIRRAMLSVDPSLPIDGIDPLPTLMRQSIREERLVARLASAFGVFALLLAAIGLYGVMTYAITRRTGEIGLRVALGAQRGDVVRLVLFDALRLVAFGLAIGVPAALVSTRLLRSQLHGVDTADPMSIGVAVGVLVASAVVAVMLPAMRASRVSPIVALRAE
jgi:predicted permease